MRTLELGMANGGSTAPVSSIPRDFSRRETDCLVLLVRGYTDEEIASDLAITHATVRFHLDGARRKAGARSRTHLAALVVARGVARP